MTEKQVEKYIREDLGYEQNWLNCMALAEAINYVADKVDYDSFALMRLLLENEEESLYYHSYGFHTRNGRELIESMRNAYYEEVQFYVE